MSLDAQMQPLEEPAGRRRPACRRSRRVVASATGALSLALSLSVLAGCTSSDETVDDSTSTVLDSEPTLSTSVGGTETESGTTVADGDGAATTASTDPSIDDDDAETASGSTTVAPAVEGSEGSEGDATKPTIQEQDAALACAQVEIGYLRLLDDGSGDDRLLTGATMAQTTGVAVYIDLGAALEGAIGSDGAAEAADALLAQCEADGYERLV